MIDLLKFVGNIYWFCVGDWNVLMTLMMFVGVGIYGSIYYLYLFDVQAMCIFGWKIVMFSNLCDVYGLLFSVIVDLNLVMVFFFKVLMCVKVEGFEEMILGEFESVWEFCDCIDVLVGDCLEWVLSWLDMVLELILFGKSKMFCEGNDFIVVIYGWLVWVAMKVVDVLCEE